MIKIRVLKWYEYEKINQLFKLLYHNHINYNNILAKKVYSIVLTAIVVLYISSLHITKNKHVLIIIIYAHL